MIPADADVAGAFPAELMDGSSGGARKVAVIPLADALVVHCADKGELESWTLADLRVETLPGGVLHLTHPAHAGALLSSSAPQLRNALVHAGAAPSLPPSRTLAIRGAVYAVIVAAAIGLFVLALPAVSSAIARHVPLTVEAQMAFPVHRILESRYCRSKSSLRSLELLARPLRLPGDPDFAGARLEIVDLPMVNAFTLPGGSIVVTRTLVEEAADPEELAGVLAHELEHVARRHVMGQVVRSAILTTGWQLTFGDFAGLMAIDPSTTMEIASRRFSRDAERDADEGAVRRLRHAGLSTRGLSAFFALLEHATTTIPEWLSTHPASAARQAMLAESGADAVQGKAVLPDRDWRAIKEACTARDR